MCVLLLCYKHYFHDTSLSHKLLHIIRIKNWDKMELAVTNCGKTIALDHQEVDIDYKEYYRQNQPQVKRTRYKRPISSEFMVKAREMRKRYQHKERSITTEELHFWHIFEIAPNFALGIWLLLSNIGIVIDGGFTHHLIWKLLLSKEYPNNRTLGTL